MHRQSLLLESISVASPCDAGWDEMKGTDRVRFCGQCQRNVYNLSAMSRREAEELIRRREGRMCVRLYKRGDGTVLTEDCPIGLRAVRRKVALIVGGVAAVLFAGFAWGAAFVGLVMSKNGYRTPAQVFRPPAPPPPQIIMGDICPPNLPPPAPPVDPEFVGPPAPPE